MTAAEAGSDREIQEFAPAKINLTLHVTGHRADGYHELESLVAFADVGDRLTLRRAPDLRLVVKGPFADGVPTGTTNLALKAARAAGVTTVEVSLDKHLPSAAGIGGGSSDAAAVLRALRRSHGAAVPSHTEILALGADVPVCMLARAAHMSGIGDIIKPVAGLPPLPAVLVNPGVAVSTAAVFAALGRRSGEVMSSRPDRADLAGLCDWLASQRNDLQPAATENAPVISDVLAEIGASGARMARMSGSGATCFGLFMSSDLAWDAAASLAARHPAWWVRATVLR